VVPAFVVVVVGGEVVVVVVVVPPGVVVVVSPPGVVVVVGGVGVAEVSPSSALMVLSSGYLPSPHMLLKSSRSGAHTMAPASPWLLRYAVLICTLRTLS
jgi:hypothetical protein